MQPDWWPCVQCKFNYFVVVCDGGALICQNQGRCVNGTICVCYPGYIGDDCSRGHTLGYDLYINRVVVDQKTFSHGINGHWLPLFRKQCLILLSIQPRWQTRTYSLIGLVFNGLAYIVFQIH